MIFIDFMDIYGYFSFVFNGNFIQLPAITVKIKNGFQLIDSVEVFSIISITQILVCKYILKRRYILNHCFLVKIMKIKKN